MKHYKRKVMIDNIGQFKTAPVQLFFLFFFLSLFSCGTDHKVLNEQYLLLNQTNPNIPDIDGNYNNKLQCTNLIDDNIETLLYAVDDFIIPYDNVIRNETNGYHYCEKILFSFRTLRVKNNLDPVSITINLHYNTNINNEYRPGKLFFRKTFKFPYNKNNDSNSSWGDLGVDYTNILLVNGEYDDTRTNIFDLGNETLIPRMQPIWVGFFVSVNRNYTFNTDVEKENNMFWLLNTDHGTDDKNENHSIEDSLENFGEDDNVNEKRSFMKITNNNNNNNNNNNFFYIDESDILRYGMTSWTNGEKVIDLIGINDTNLNLDFTVSLQSCPYSHYEGDKDDDEDLLTKGKYIFSKEMVALIIIVVNLLSVLCTYIILRVCFVYMRFRKIDVRLSEEEFVVIDDPLPKENKILTGDISKNPTKNIDDINMVINLDDSTETSRRHGNQIVHQEEEKDKNFKRTLGLKKNPKKCKQGSKTG